ncbi:MAG TPA: alpha/beta fold hydrolase [Anaerolineales bacterium]|nr:alpha/beta fold hydrolase [Anaerolineales bacterium]
MSPFFELSQSKLGTLESSAFAHLKARVNSKRAEDSANRLRLICFPYAGGSVANFYKWRASLQTSDIGLCVCELPAPSHPINWENAIAMLCKEILTSLANRPAPIALWGHSLGAWVAYEVAIALRVQTVSPVWLGVAAMPAPQLPKQFEAISHLPDQPFCTAIRAFGGTPDSLWQSPELLALILPALRRDFALREGYQWKNHAPLAIPITAWSGSQDRWASQSEVDAWGKCTTANFEHILLDGGHFFPFENSLSILQQIENALDSI